MIFNALFIFFITGIVDQSLAIVPYCFPAYQIWVPKVIPYPKKPLVEISTWAIVMLMDVDTNYG